MVIGIFTIVIIIAVLAVVGVTLIALIFSTKKKKSQMIFSKDFKSATEEEIYNKIMSDVNQ